MNVLEHEEVQPHPEHPVVLPQDTFLENERKLEIAGALWQIFRLVLLAWSLLCFYCCVRLCLNFSNVEFISVASNFIIGLLAWILACKIGRPMEWPTDDDINAG